MSNDLDSKKSNKEGASYMLSQVRRDSFKLTAQMSSGSILGLLLTFPIRIITNGILGPSGLGILQVASLFDKYSAKADLGMKYNLAREVPILIGRGEKTEAKEVGEIVFTWMVLVSIVLAICCWSLYVSVGGVRNVLSLSNMVLVTIIVICGRANTYLRSYSKGYGLFNSIGVNSLLNSLIGPFIALGLVVWFNVTGALISQVIIGLILGANYLRGILRGASFRLRLKFPLGTVWRLMKTGGYLYVNNLSEGMIKLIAITMLASFVAIDKLGLFNLGLVMVGGTKLVAGLIMVLYRHMLLEWGSGRKHVGREQFRGKMETPLVMYGLGLSVAVGFVYFGYEVAIRLFLPKFSASVGLAQMLAIAELGTTGVVFFRMYYNVTGQFGRRLILVAFGFVIINGMSLGLLMLGLGATGVALGMAVGYPAFSLLLFVSGSKEVYGSIAYGLSIWVRLMICSIVLILCLNFLTTWQPVWPSVTNHWLIWIFEFGMAGLRFSASVILTTSAFLLLFRKHRPEREIKEAVHYFLSSVRPRFLKTQDPLLDSNSKCL